MKAIYIGIVLLVGVMLAGCSGSSGTTTTATQSASKVSITATNEGAVTKSAISAATQSLGGGNLSYVGGVQTTTDSSNDRVLFKAADFALQQMAQQQNAPASVIGAVTSYTCTVSGTASVDTNNTATSGSNATYYKVTYNSCVYTAGTTYNGTIFITGVSRTPATGVATGLTATLDFNFSVASTGSPTVSLVGGFTIAASGMGLATRTDSLTGTSLVVSAGTQSFSLTNFSFTSAYNDITTPTFYTDNINFTTAFADSATPANNMAYSFATTQTNLIVAYTNEAYPRSGQFVVSGGGTTALRVTILSGASAGTSSGSLTLELSNNSGTTWGTPTPYTWATL